MSQGGVAVMGSQIFVERERVHFSLHAPCLCSSSQTWHGEECCFQMLRRKGGQSMSEISSLWCIYCGLVSSPSLSQTINDPALTDLMIHGRSTGSHKRCGGFSAWDTCGSWLFLHPKPKVFFQHERLFLLFLNLSGLFVAHCPATGCTSPASHLCVWAQLLCGTCPPDFLLQIQAITFCPMLSLGLIIYFYWILDKTTIEEFGFWIILQPPFPEFNPRK